jgi:hypothetical protein
LKEERNKQQREYEAPTYQETLKKPPPQIPAPNPEVGGWGKFCRQHIKPQKNTASKKTSPKLKEKKLQHLKKGGRGWLHVKP